MGWLGTVTFNVDSRYNYGDFNRENEDAEEIYSLMRQMGYSLALPYPIVKDRTNKSFPTVSLINNLRNNIQALVDAYPEAKAEIETVGPVTGTFASGEESMIFGAASIPIIDIPTNRKQVFNFNHANQLEVTLDFLYKKLIEKANSFKYCGTFYAGEEGLIF